jgi:cell division protein FtsW (lipid II flippase)
VARDSRARRDRRGASLPEVRALSLRNRELLFLIVVGVLTAVGFASVYIARQDVISTSSLTYAGFFLLLFLAAHMVTRYTVPFADPYMLPIAGLLAAVGLTEIYRLEPDDAFKQGVWIVVAVALFALTLFLLRYDYRQLESYKYIFGLTAIALLLLPILPVLGLTVNGARLWVHFGSLRFQPGEVAKIMLIIFLAAYMREKREVLAQGRPKDWGPLLLIWVLAMLVLLETRDLGGGLLYFGIFLAMLYVATSRLAYVAAGLGLFLVGAVGVWKVTPHVQERVTIWLHPWTEHKVYCPLSGQPDLRQNCQSFQLVKSLYSIANGGYGGTGLGKGTVTNVDGHALIPGATTDFIYSVLSQEVGLIGAAGVILLYMIFVLRGIRTALLAQDGFSKLLAAGLTFGFALQTFIIVGGILRLIPLTGITLPFVSYGGSSVVANFVLLAGLLLVSNRANRDLAR